MTAKVVIGKQLKDNSRHSLKASALSIRRDVRQCYIMEIQFSNNFHCRYTEKLSHALQHALHTLCVTVIKIF